MTKTEHAVKREVLGKVEVAMSETKRDQIFEYAGERVLIDTAVLPTIRLSHNGGKTWTEGAGTLYLMRHMGITSGDAALFRSFDSDFCQWAKNLGVEL